MTPTTMMPVHEEPRDTGDDRAEEGVALCLSGGGYRAMLFHLGAFWRLNQLGILPKLNRVSCVSGGSIAGAVLGMKWKKLDFDSKGVAKSFGKQVVDPIRALADETIDLDSIFGGAFLLGTINDKIIKEYKRHLFGHATLQDLPSDGEGPRFIFNATNVQTGALFRFSKPYLADHRVGQVLNPKVELAVAVAASSAFPPFLSPAKLRFKKEEFQAFKESDLTSSAYTTEVYLSDGGVYDNLGLETAYKRYKTLLVSDGGGKMAPEGEPHADWARHSVRVNSIIDNQVRSLRYRQLIQAYKDGVRSGAYWGIRTKISEYQLDDALAFSLDKATELAKTPTRLKRMSDDLQEWLINWGYAVCDAAVRKYAVGLVTNNIHPAFPF